jgi:membrane-bound ClpP family serine protease
VFARAVAVARIRSAGQSVITTVGATTACSAGTDVALGTRIAVVARLGIVGVNTAVLRIAAIVRAHVAVVAGQ